MEKVSVNSIRSFVPIGIIILILCTALGYPCWSAKVQLLSPSDGSQVAWNQGEIILKWKAFDGAQSYRCWNLNDLGLTSPGGNAELNPHLVESEKTEFSIYATRDTEWTWYIIPYSDTEGLYEIPNSRSDTWTFDALPSSMITPTPTPGAQLADLNQDGQEDSIDVFYFANVWYLERMGANLPEYYDRANLIQRDTLPDPEIINEADLLAFKEVFRDRSGPLPTPVMPAPVLQRPVTNFQMSVPGYNATNQFYEWHPLGEATDYEIQLVGPDPMGTRSYTTPDTIYYNENASGQDLITQIGTLWWKVRGRNAEGAGEWSETRIVNVVPVSFVSLADLNDDEQVNYKDIFKFSRSWQDVEGSIFNNYLTVADLYPEDPDGHVEEADLLVFQKEYRDYRSQFSECDLSAPHIDYPDDGVTFTGAQIRQGGIAYIDWDTVSGASGYRITFKSGGNRTVRIVFQIPYEITESDLNDTVLTNSNPVQYTVEALCDNGIGGTLSEERTLTVTP